MVHIAIKADIQKADEAFLVGALRKSPGVKITVLENKADRVECDCYAIIGVKHAKLMLALQSEGLPYLYWDKGYNREWPTWWRVSYNSHQPVDYLHGRTFSPDRAAVQGWLVDLKPWRPHGVGTVLFVGASAKYHLYHGLPEPTEYASNVVGQIARYTRAPIVYRPKPSWDDAEPVSGARFSRHRSFESDLDAAGLVVTHGSSACFEALRAGIPAVVLGHGVTRDISSTVVSGIANPRIPTDEERYKLLVALAHFQWSVSELENGAIKRILENFNATGVLSGKA
jgi:hypothetical protein